MKKFHKIAASLLFIIAVLTVNADPLIIDAKSFASELKSNKNIVVIDVQAADVYARQHIQGAINIPHKSLYKAGPIDGQFKDAADLAVIFGKAGVSESTSIVIYDDGSQKYNSRVWWVLKYIGATDVKLFHKEMSLMEASRIPLTSTPTKRKPVVFTPTINESMNISMADVKTLIENPNALLLDAREPDEFNGIDKDKKSKGHLPGAILLNYKEILISTGAYQTKEEIMAIAAKYGLTPEKEVVVYCQTGIKAAVLYVGLKEISGFPNVKLYAGAYAEWASVPENKIIR
ncbi:MAG: sulfurtransferase [Bacteroidales bacterium]|nr:sulfurtransferase [Bacteroidales bacterium]